MNPAVYPILKNKKRYVILDTCVLEKAYNGPLDRGNKIFKYFKELENEGFSLAMSEYTGYENLFGLWGEKLSKAALILDTYEQKEVTKRVLFFAAQLGGLYKSISVNVKNCGDLIIAATAFLEKGFVLTNNLRDFPCPYFLQNKWVAISTEQKDASGKVWCTETLDLVLFEPNTKRILQDLHNKNK